MQVSQALSLHEPLLEQTQLLQNHVRNLSLAATPDPQSADSSLEASLLLRFSQVLDHLFDLCTLLLDDPAAGAGAELVGECDDLVRAGAAGYAPTVPSSIGELGGQFNSTHTLLQRLLEILASETFSGATGPVDTRPAYFTALVSC